MERPSVDNRPSALTLAIVGCVLVFVGGIGLWATQAEGELAARFVTALASLITGVPIIVGLLVLSAWGVACVPTLVQAWDWLEARKSSKNVTKTVTHETETKTTLTREEAARAFWIEACRVAEATGNPGWRNGYKNFLSSDKDWQVWIKAPLVAQRFAIPKNTGNGETIIWREGIDPRYVRGWLAGNLLPLPPEGWPPVWRKPQTADTKDSGNTGEYSPDTADTVYAKDV